MGMLQLTSRSTNFPYLYRGIVKDTNDPLNLGRCRIHVPDIHGSFNYPVDILPWSRPVAVVPTIPDLEEVVWVLFEAGQKESPVYIRGVISTKRNPLPEDTSIVLIYSQDDCKIYYNKELGQLILKNKDTFVTIDQSYIDLVSDRVLVNGKDIGSGGGGHGGIWYYDVVKIL